LGIARDVRLHGKVRADAVARRLEGCHVLVLPRPASRQAEGGFPTKLGEYLATGRPVVTTSVGDIPKYLQAGINCLMVPPGNLPLMSEAIASVATDYGHAESIGQAGQQLAQTTFHPRRVADVFVRFVTGFSPARVPQPIGRRDIRDSKGLGGA
jgi:glycosyltransferase involved in cell wall biosynthesis